MNATERLERRVRDLEIMVALLLAERQEQLGHDAANILDGGEAHARALIWARVAEHRDAHDYDLSSADPPMGPVPNYKPMASMASRRVTDLETQLGIMRDALEAAAYVCDCVAEAPARPETVAPRYARSVARQCRRAIRAPYNPNTSEEA